MPEEESKTGGNPYRFRFKKKREEGDAQLSDNFYNQPPGQNNQQNPQQYTQQGQQQVYDQSGNQSGYPQNQQQDQQQNIQQGQDNPTNSNDQNNY